MDSIRQAIESATGAPSGDPEQLTERVWLAVREAMKADGMIFLDKPMTVSMLDRQIEKTIKFETALIEVAQELNDALGNLDYAESRESAGQALKALVDVARQSVKLIEGVNPNGSLYKQPQQSDEDRLWEHHMLRGSLPSDDAIKAVRKRSPHG